jgi:hypothetical protein
MRGPQFYSFFSAFFKSLFLIMVYPCGIEPEIIEDGNSPVLAAVSCSSNMVLVLVSAQRFFKLLEEEIA